MSIHLTRSAARLVARMIGLATAFLLVSSAARAGTATLSWNPNPESNITGYVVLYGTQPGVHPFSQPVGNVTSATLTNLAAGQTYYFVVQAVNAAGLAGPVSQEVSATIDQTSPSGETMDAWKARFGVADMAADPDGDGVSNMDEFLDGTDPRIPNTWTLTDGATGGFRTRLAVANPGTDTAEITITFLPQGGTPIVQHYSIPGRSRQTVVVNDIEGLQNTSFSARVTTARGGVLVERTMTWGGGEQMDSASTSKAVASPQTTWYFAEGDSAMFDTYLVLTNSGEADANAAVTFMLTNGQTVTAQYAVPAGGRQSIYANDVSGVGKTSFGIVVQATAPITAERAMYFSTATTAWKGGLESAGVSAPSTQWYLAEGQTGQTFSEYLALANPNAAAALATVRYLTPAGATIARTYQLAPTSRATVNVNEVAGLEDTEVAAAIDSTLPIVAERSMFWPGQPGQWYEGHNSAAMQRLGLEWAFSEGETGGAHNAISRFLMVNPGTTDAAVTLTLLRANGLDPVAVRATVKAGSRLSLDSTEFPLLSGEQFGTVVESTNGVPIAVERSLYWDGEGKVLIAGTNESGTLIRKAEAAAAKTAPAGAPRRDGTKIQSK